MLPDPEQLAEMCLLAVKTATAPLLARIQVLEQRAVPVPVNGRDGVDGVDGKDADPQVVDELRGQVAALTTKLADIRQAAEVTDVKTRMDVSDWIKAATSDVLAAMPAPAPPDTPVDAGTIDALFRKAWAETEPQLSRPPVRQRRVIRDAAGKIERVVDELIN